MEKIEKGFFLFAFVGLSFYTGSIVVKEISKDFGTAFFFFIICIICLLGAYLLSKGLIGKKKLATNKKS